MKQYLEVAQRIIDDGEWIYNDRTGQRCKVIINVNQVYDVGAGEYPLLTTRKYNHNIAIAELLGYIRGYSNAADFRKLGTRTWDANANENTAWLNNPARQGTDDMGRVYGVQGRQWQTPNGTTVDQLKKIVNNLSNGIDDRGEILMFWNPGEFDQGCLRPCMYSHTFSLVNDTLHLTSVQRSSDWPLGAAANQIQCYVLLALMARITGNNPGKVYHQIVNAHVYENQYELLKEQVTREPYSAPTLTINPDIQTLEDLETWVTVDDFKLVNYQCHPAIKYPFSV